MEQKKSERAARGIGAWQPPARQQELDEADRFQVTTLSGPVQWLIHLLETPTGFARHRCVDPIQVDVLATQQSFIRQCLSNQGDWSSVACLS